MTSLFFIKILLFIILFVGLVACIQADNSDHNQDKVTLTSSQPAMLCLEYDDKTYTALISGRKNSSVDCFEI